MKIKDFIFLYSTIGIATAVRTIGRQCLDCMCQASSTCNLNLRCHNTADGSYYCGPYQISWAYWADAGKPGSSGFSNDFEKCLTDRSCAEKTIAGYMSKWASDCNGDGQIDCLDFASIHKTGPTTQCNQSWLKSSKYWKDFTRCYLSSSDSSFLPSTGSSSGFTGSSHFPSNNPNHEVERIEPHISNAYAISSSDPRPISRSDSERTFSASSSSSPILPISSSTSSSYFPNSNTSSHYSSSSTYSNYTEITEETSSGNFDSMNYEPSRTLLLDRTVYGSTMEVNYPSSNSETNTRSVIPLTQPPIRIDVHPISNDYTDKTSVLTHTQVTPTTSHNHRTTSDLNNINYEQPTALVPLVSQPALSPVVPSSIISSVVSQACLNCLCQASSKCQLNKGCDGAYCGPYLLSWAYWTDGGKPGSTNGLDYPLCSQNQSCAEQAVNGYMNKWTRDCNNDGIVDCTDYALIHKLGPHGCSRLEALKSTEYWNRFETCHSSSTAISSSTENEKPAIQPINPNSVTENENIPEVIEVQPDVHSSTSVVLPQNYPSSQPLRARELKPIEPIGRRNDFHEQPLNVPRPQPNGLFTPRISSGGSSTSNIRISFNNREVVNTALQDTPIIHPPQPAEPSHKPVRSFNTFNGRLSVAPQTNSFNPRPQSRTNSAFSTETFPEVSRSNGYLSNSNSNSNSDSNIREVPANNDNTGFDDSSFSGRSIDPELSENVNPSSLTFSSDFDPFSPVNSTEIEVSQDCLNCMCHAATRCNTNIGCSSDSRGKFVCGIYQVDWEYWSDAGKPENRADLSNLENFQMCLNNRKCADETIRGYMRTHKMDCNGDGKIDCHDFAALHVVGPQNCKASWYLDSKYYSDFNECYNF